MAQCSRGESRGGLPHLLAPVADFSSHLFATAFHDKTYKISLDPDSEQQLVRLSLHLSSESFPGLPFHLLLAQAVPEVGSFAHA